MGRFYFQCQASLWMRRIVAHGAAIFGEKFIAHSLAQGPRDVIGGFGESRACSLRLKGMSSANRKDTPFRTTVKATFMQNSRRRPRTPPWVTLLITCPRWVAKSFTCLTWFLDERCDMNQDSIRSVIPYDLILSIGGILYQRLFSYPNRLSSQTFFFRENHIDHGQQVCGS